MSLTNVGNSTLTITTSNTTPSGNYTLTISGTDGTVTEQTTAGLNVQGPQTDLFWRSTSSATWDTGSLNWSNSTTSASVAFNQNANVVFDDAVGVTTSISIASGLAAQPTLMTVDADINNFSFTGPGKISGPVTIVKNGNSILTFAMTNDFTGSVTVNEGTLKVATSNSLGTATVLINDGATLDINGCTNRGVTVAGDGAGGLGVIYNSGVRQDNAFKAITLADDATFGGTGRWDLRGTTATLSTGGQPYNITKVGTNQVSFVNLTSIDSALNNIYVNEGKFAIQQIAGSSVNVGSVSGSIFVASNATLEVDFGIVGLTKPVVLQGGSQLQATSGANSIAATIALSPGLPGNCTFAISSGYMTNSGIITGLGNLVKTGNSNLVLTANNTYSGDTLINAGILCLSGSGAIAHSDQITIASGAVLDVNGRNDKTLTLGGGQTLSGKGTLNGSLLVPLGSTVAPGNSTGALTVTNLVNLQGTTSMELDKGNSTNDVIRGAQAIIYGGTLLLTNLSGTLAAGDSFKLFSANTYSNAFANILPGIPAIGLGWDTSTLAVDGTLRIISVPTPPPQMGNITFDDEGNLVLSGTGVAGWPFKILTSTNISLPLTNWPIYFSGVFDPAGAFIITNSGGGSSPQQLYILQLQ
jgi:autotransporter-associated beta strand protein